MKKFLRKNDEAVSEIIAVILMVALTVILAAVIAAFVFGLVGNLGKTKVVAATALKPNTSAIQVVYHGGQDAPSVVSLNVSINNALAISNMGGGSSPMHVGCSTIFYGGSNAYSLKTHVVITANFNDGSQQVVLDTYV